MTIPEGGTVLISSSLNFLVIFQFLGSIAPKGGKNYGPKEPHVGIQYSDKTDEVVADKRRLCVLL